MSNHPRFLKNRGWQCAENVSVGAIIDRPWILPKQNPSPQGENKVTPFGKPEKLRFSAGDQ